VVVVPVPVLMLVPIPDQAVAVLVGKVLMEL
jgi:hypothetical protein